MGSTQYAAKYVIPGYLRGPYNIAYGVLFRLDLAKSEKHEIGIYNFPIDFSGFTSRVDTKSKQSSDFLDAKTSKVLLHVETSFPIRP